MKTDALSFPIEIRDVTWLKPYEGNAKLHPPEQIESLANNMLRLGYDQPIVAEADGTIIKGHGRTLAALRLVELGHAKFARVPVVVRHDLTKEEANAARLTDNRVSSQLYDTDKLKDELSALNALEFDMSGLGFDEKELEMLTADLSMLDDAVFVSDVGAAVEEQRRENAEKVLEIDGKELPLADGFGFRKLLPAQIRRVKAFMGKLEAETGQLGADALMRFLDDLGIPA